MKNSTNKREYKDIGKNSLLLKINRQDSFNIKNTLKRYEQAKQSAQSIDYPNRYDLLEIYKDIKEDSHLKAVMKQRISRITGLPFSILNETNYKKNDKITTLFEQNWFYQFLTYIMEAVFYGNSLIELQKNNSFVNVKLVPREHIIPEFQELKIDPWNLSGNIDYTQPIYYNTIIEVNNENNSRNLGELLNLAKLVMLKSEVLMNWGQFIEIFGQPLRVATTDTQDPLEIDQIYSFLSNLGRSGYMVKNSNTNLDFIESGSSDGQLFEKIISLINSEISKQVLGVTMLTDDGSSRSQAEVHQKASYLITKSDIKFVEYIINDILIPKLKNLNLINVKNIIFKFDEIEILTIDEKLKIDQFLFDSFGDRIDISYYEKRYNVTINERQNTVEEDIIQQSQNDILQFAKEQLLQYGPDVNITNK